MVIYFDTTGSIEALAKGLSLVQSSSEVESIQIFAAASNNFSSRLLNPLLHAMQVPIFGGVFPAILHQGQLYERGTLLIGIPAKNRIAIVSTLHDAYEIEMDAAISELGDPFSAGRTIFLWADGLTKKLSGLLTALHNQYGLTYRILGGGTGSPGSTHGPSLITNEGMLADAAVLALVDLPAGIAARHGWIKVAGPFLVTRSSGNVIYTLNWRPALQVYRSVIEDIAGVALEESHFYKLTQAFPFGIQRYGVERIVREPICIEGEHLICQGDVPEGTLVDILTGSETSLRVAAEDALFQAENHLRPYGSPRTLFICESASRKSFLQEGFAREVAALKLPGAESVGVLSVGEFICNGRDYPAFLNKSTVIGAFPV